MKVTIPETVLSTELNDEAVLLNLESGTYFALDAVGLDMWRLLCSGATLESACDELVEQYDVSRDVLARDLREFVAALAKQRLVVVLDE